MQRFTKKKIISLNKFNLMEKKLTFRGSLFKTVLSILTIISFSLNMSSQCSVVTPSGAGPFAGTVIVNGCTATLTPANIAATFSVSPSGACDPSNTTIWYDDDADRTTAPSWGGFLTADELDLSTVPGLAIATGTCPAGPVTIYVTFVNNGDPATGG
ncbi:MAG: hypothetical protein ACI8RP_002121, partial [Urechidicola sp.]